ncbi:MAG: PD-(D/E)XK nuclease family protein [Burkholderiales bacterium]|nr:PD-(D/E)XK nuclease family protein [Burkholderiales bacterium]MDR4517953.1 PD-(D/E)XK nuclease family protein [Nitrosomonas sp.]
MVLKSSVATVTQNCPLNISFSREAINYLLSRNLDSTRKAIQKISSQFRLSDLNQNIGQKFEDLFGHLNSYHPFHHKRSLGFTATEQQITKGISYFIDPSVQGEVGMKRLIAWIQSILASHVNSNLILQSLKSEDMRSLEVHAEYPMPAQRRADLLIRWSNSGNDYAVIVEAKFDHHVTTGQLSTYRAQLKKLVSEPQNGALVLLTKSGDEAPSGNKDWHPKAWFTVMSNWECQLNDDKDLGFSLFRQFIWNKLES